MRPNRGKLFIPGIYKMDMFVWENKHNCSMFLFTYLKKRRGGGEYDDYCMYLVVSSIHVGKLEI